MNSGTDISSARPSWLQVRDVTPVFSMFFLEAFVLGNWIPRIPDVKTLFGLTATELGLVLFILASGTLVSFLTGSSLLKRLGLKWSCTISLPLWCIAILLVPHMPGFSALVILVFAAGLAIGIIEIAMNTAADALEKREDRRLMSKAHGFWSLGSLVGALLGAGIASWGVDVATHFLVVLGITAVICIIMALRVPDFKDPSIEDDLTENNAGGKIITLPARGLVLLCIMPIGIMVVEGAFIDWSALFVRDVLNGTPMQIGLIYAAFSTVMAATRLSGDWLLDRFGSLSVARVSALASTFGIALFALSSHAAIAFVAALFAGLGTAIFYPLTMSAAARKPGNAEDNVAAMSLFAFSSFMLAPPLIGFLADEFGLRIALLLIAPLAASSLMLTSQLEEE